MFTCAEPIIEHRGNGIWRLERDLTVYRDGLPLFTITAGYKTDLASIPKHWRWLLKPSDARYRAASLVHDYLYSHQRVAEAVSGREDDRKFSDRVFRHLNKHWARWGMYLFVRMTGGKRWRELSS